MPRHKPKAESGTAQLIQDLSDERKRDCASPLILRWLVELLAVLVVVEWDYGSTMHDRWPTTKSIQHIVGSAGCLTNVCMCMGMSNTQYELGITSRLYVLHEAHGHRTRSQRTRRNVRPPAADESPAVAYVYIYMGHMAWYI